MAGHLPTITNVSRVTFKWGPTESYNVMHFKQDSIDPAGLFGAFDANFTANQWACLGTSQKIQEVDITPLDGVGLTESFVPPNTAKWNGVQTGDIAPAVAGVVSLRTALRGRPYRGRIFLGPCTEGSGNQGIMTGSIATAVANAWTSVASALASDGVFHVVASYLKEAAYPVLNYLVRNAFGTMRPRQSRLA